MSRTQADRSSSTRAALLGAARALFAERGYVDVPAEEIVGAAGVTRGALYHHFRDKRDLFRAVHESLEAELVQRIAAGIGETTDPVEVLVRGTDLFLDACEDPAFARIALQEAPSVLGWKEWREIDARHAMGLTSAVLQAAMDAGAIVRQPVEPLAQILVSAMGEAGLLIASGTSRDAVRAPLLAILTGLQTSGR
jgi:AcrR family transcriptional regulator